MLEDAVVQEGEAVHGVHRIQTQLQCQPQLEVVQRRLGSPSDVGLFPLQHAGAAKHQVVVCPLRQRSCDGLVACQDQQQEALLEGSAHGVPVVEVGPRSIAAADQWHMHLVVEKFQVLQVPADPAGQPALEFKLIGDLPLLAAETLAQLLPAAGDGDQLAHLFAGHHMGQPLESVVAPRRQNRTDEVGAVRIAVQPPSQLERGQVETVHLLRRVEQPAAQLLVEQAVVDQQHAHPLVAALERPLHHAAIGKVPAGQWIGELLEVLAQHRRRQTVTGGIGAGPDVQGLHG